ncbi:Aspartate-semialdehyde dehydrogenase [Penicillium psychrosexuale]|uniref:Aspartate-semialdehyde dehydrogenase n=1 Tax=Penicillium psychrosexuale TaxID=1002107 RepID=UPI0025454051|nr:Aspartate-semialdehyde dehydrogenase [Penicillium psychrosexuale]KAJ5800929.1 Aspartate-semialdehyde dehydrogenase [Penicillium psychrosexuale]
MPKISQAPRYKYSINPHIPANRGVVHLSGCRPLTNRGARQLAESDIAVGVKCYKPSTTSPVKRFIPVFI